MADKPVGGAGMSKEDYIKLKYRKEKSQTYKEIEKEYGLGSDSEDEPEKMDSFESLYPVKPLDMVRDPRFGCSFMLIGSTKSGKTTMLNYIMKKYFADSINVFMSQSLHADIYKDARKTMACAPTYVPEIVRTCYLINKNVGTKHQYDFNVVLDDVVGGKNDIQMTRLLTIYRNSRISCILSAQSPILMNSIGRGNVNFVLLGRLNADESVKYAVEKYLRTYFPMGLRLIECMRLYRKLTEDHTFFLVNTLEGTVTRVRLGAKDLVGIPH